MTQDTVHRMMEAELEKQCADLSGPLLQVCQYVLRGGRRTRAALLLGAAPRDDQRAVQAAAAIELLHAATLLQDDIFDEGRMRHGRLAAHLEFGKASTILASDWMLIRSLEITCEVHPSFFQQLARAGTAMVKAEACEMTPPATQSLEEARLVGCQIAQGKTATLFGVCLYGAALLQGATASQCAVWQDIGISMGITYQLVDDCIDSYSDTFAAGKTVGGDLKAGRLTLPVLLAAATLEKSATSSVLYAIQSGPLQPAMLEELQTALQSAKVRSQLHSTTLGRLALHRQEAHTAGIDSLVIGTWASTLLKKAAVFAPESESNIREYPVVRNQSSTAERLEPSRTFVQTSSTLPPGVCHTTETH